MKNQRGSLTMIAFFLILVFSVYGVIIFGKSASSYIRQTSSIETIQNAYGCDVDNAAEIAERLGKPLHNN